MAASGQGLRWKGVRGASESLEMFHIFILVRGSQLGAALTPRGYLATSGDILGCRRRGAAGIQWWKSGMLLNTLPRTEQPGII